MISQILFLESGQLRRAAPFFTLYFVLFAVLTLADGLSLSLVVARLGASALPQLQAVAAICVMVAVAWYLRSTSRQNEQQVFALILGGAALLFVTVWVGLQIAPIEQHSLGLLFVVRELVYALVLLHFGAYLQEFFTRAELNRVMPVIYAGGRFGGILAGVCLERASFKLTTAQMLGGIPFLLGAAIFLVWLIARFVPAVDEPCDKQTAIRTPTNSQASGLLSFASQIWQSPLLFWIMVTTTALFLCRGGLSLQSGMFFERQFSNEAELSQFLGRYSQISLAISLPIQLFVVGRLVAWLGLSGTQISYAFLVVLAALGTLGETSLAMAVFARFVETELRFAIRNPLAQMTVNLFPKHTRTVVRAWSLGMLIPLTTLTASIGLGVLMRWNAIAIISACTVLTGLLYVVASIGLATGIRRHIKAEPNSDSVRDRSPVTCGKGRRSTVRDKKAHRPSRFENRSRQVA